MEQKDYYEILSLDKDAGQKQIKEAYRKLTFKYHPDRNKERPESAEKMNSTLYRLDIDRNEGCET